MREDDATHMTAVRVKLKTAVRAAAAACVVLLAAASAPAMAGADTLTLSASPSPVPGGGTVTIAAGGVVTSAGARLDMLAEPAADGCGMSWDEVLEPITTPAMVVETKLESSVETGPLGVSIPLKVDLEPSYNPGGGAPSSTIIASPGEYRVCAYLETSNFKGERTVHATATTTFTVRVPNDTITLAPTFSSPSERYTVPISYSIEPGTTPVSVSVGLFPTFLIEGKGYNCPFPAIFKEYPATPGGSSVTYTAEHGMPGIYGLCVRILSSPLATFELARANMTITVLPPSGSHGASGKACVVPKLAGKTLTSARRALAHGGCALGRITHRHRRGHRRGTVLAQGARPGLRLAAGAHVSVVLAR